jgi:hypothetical protein
MDHTTWPAGLFHIGRYIDTMAYPSLDVVLPHLAPSNDIATMNGSLSF